MNAMNHILEADGVQLNYGLRPILTDVYVRCETGKVTGLLGRNGSGKSSLMRIIYGILPAYARSVRINGKSTPQAFLSPDQVMYLPQHPLIPKNLTLSEVFRDHGLDAGVFSREFPEYEKHLHGRLSGLSGGETRMLELYLMLKSRARFILLDEPFTHISPLQVEKLREMIDEEKKNKGILITDHIYRQVVEISDVLYLLAEGKTHLIRRESDLGDLGYIRI
jgi:ABC-type multidrug transport system ATPase subunit